MLNETDDHGHHKHTMEELLGETEINSQDGLDWLAKTFGVIQK